MSFIFQILKWDCLKIYKDKKITVKELIEKLKEFPDGMIVKYDDDSIHSHIDYFSLQDPGEELFPSAEEIYLLLS